LLKPPANSGRTAGRRSRVPVLNPRGRGINATSNARFAKLRRGRLIHALDLIVAGTSSVTGSRMAGFFAFAWSAGTCPESASLLASAVTSSI